MFRRVIISLAFFLPLFSLDSAPALAQTRTAVAFLGAWSSSNAPYAVNDQVTFSGGLFNSLVPVNTATPVANTTTAQWQFIATTTAGAGGTATPATSSAAGTVQLAAGQTSNQLAPVATTGSYADLTGKPTTLAADAAAASAASAAAATAQAAANSAAAATAHVTDNGSSILFGLPIQMSGTINSAEDWFYTGAAAPPPAAGSVGITSAASPAVPFRMVLPSTPINGPLKATYTAGSITFTANLTSGSATLAGVSSVANLAPGQPVTCGTNAPTTLGTIGTTTVTVATAPTVAGTGVTCTVPNNTDVISVDAGTQYDAAGAASAAVAPLINTQIAGTAGVTAHYFTSEVSPATATATFTTAAAGSCGAGVADRTAASGSSFSLSDAISTVQVVADGPITSGDIIIASTANPGKALDSGQTSADSVSDFVSVCGKAASTASSGGLVTMIPRPRGDKGRLTDLPNVQTGSYSLQASDNHKLVTMVCAASPCVLTIPTLNIPNFRVKVQSTGAAPATLYLAAGSFNGSAAAAAIGANGKISDIYTDATGTAWFGDNWDTIEARVLGGICYTKFYPGASLDARVNAANADATTGANGCFSHTISSFGEPDTIIYAGVTPSSFSIDGSNNVTVVATNTLAVGTTVFMSNISPATYLNGPVFTVTSATTSQVVLSTSNFTHAAVSSTTLTAGTLARFDTAHSILNQITLGDTSLDPMTWQVPPAGVWYVNMTGGTGDWIYENMNAIVAGTGKTNHNLRTLENTSVANGSLGCFSMSGIISSGGYYGLSGLSFNDRNYTQNIASGQCMSTGGEDNSAWRDFAVNEYGLGKHALRPGNSGPCCAQVYDNVNLYGNDLSADVLFVTSSNNGPESVLFTNSSIGHPGPGYANVSCTDTGSNPITKLQFINTYMELNNTSSTNYAVNLDGCASIKLDGPSFSYIGTGVVIGSTSYPGVSPAQAMVHVTNRYPTSLSIQGLQRQHGQAANLCTIQDDNLPFCIPTDANGFINQFNSNISYFDSFVAIRSFQLGQGAAIASASTIVPLSPVQHVTGPTTINTITVPTYCTTAHQSCVQELIMDGGAPISNSGNVATAINPTVGSLVFLNYDIDNSKWVTPGTTTSGAGLGANTFTGAQTVTAPAAASAPAVSVTGAVYTAGTTTTAIPAVFFGTPGATNWTAGGAQFGLDPTTGANIYQFNFNHATMSSLSAAGLLFSQTSATQSGYETVVAGGYGFSSTSSPTGGVDTRVCRSAAGFVEVGTGGGCNANGGFTGIQYGASLLYSAAGTALPACALAIKGTSAVVSDATSPTFMGAYTSGGAITAAVICSYNGTTYAWLTR